MAKTTIDTWDENFFRLSDLFKPIIPAFNILNHDKNHWPGLIEYQALLRTHARCISNKQKIPIQFVEQATECLNYQAQYEPRIYLSGEVQTRLKNWHDFFQVLVWKTFPKTKALLNSLHYQASSNRLKNDRENHRRTKIENFLTLFDECGIVIVSYEEELLQLIENFQWTNLFWKNRKKFSSNIACFTFGHAMYEKALNPYIGMTANAILIHSDKGFFNLNAQERLFAIDELIIAKINRETLLNPFPVLGVPDWHKANKSLTFYQNENYFRKGRRKTQAP